MNKVSITEINKTIEVFMTGRELMPNGQVFGRKRGFPKQYENWYDTINVKSLHYHTSWDKLIPVCAKCLSITSEQRRPSVNHCNDLDWLECEISIALCEYDKPKVHLAVYNFITAFNNK